MSRFTSHLGLELLEDSHGRPILRDGRCQWRLVAPLTYEVGAEGSGEAITVPAFSPAGLTDAQLAGLSLNHRGQVTDLASIPRPFRSLLPADGPWAKIAVVHDYLYSTLGMGGRYTREEADKILLEGMVVLGVPAWKRQVIYWAVRAFGGRGWGT